MRNLLLLLVVLGTLSFTLSKEVTRNVEIATISSGKLAPQISLKDQNNQTVDLSKFKGAQVYLNLWTTWSDHSKEELPFLAKHIDKHGKYIHFLNISIDYKRDRSKWKKHIEAEQLKGEQLIVENDWQSDLIKKYNVVKIPRAILIDPNGKIVDAFAPIPSQEAQLDKLLASLPQ